MSPTGSRLQMLMSLLSPMSVLKVVRTVLLVVNCSEMLIGYMKLRIIYIFYTNYVYLDVIAPVLSVRTDKVI